MKTYIVKFVIKVKAESYNDAEEIAMEIINVENCDIESESFEEWLIVPYKELKIKTFQDIIDFIKENKIEHYKCSISSPEGFIEYKIGGIDMSYSSESAMIDISEVYNLMNRSDE